MGAERAGCYAVPMEVKESMPSDNKRKNDQKKPGRDDRKPKGPAITPEERRQMISDLAYMKGEKRGGRPGDALQDWLDAEAEIDARLASEEGGRRRTRPQIKAPQTRRGRKTI